MNEMTWADAVEPSLGQTWTRQSQRSMLAAYLTPIYGATKSNSLAVALIDRFDSLPTAINAEAHHIIGVGKATANTARYLHLLRNLLTWSCAAAVERDKPILSSWTQLTEYCHLQMAFRDKEQFRVLFMDKKNRLIADECMWTGTIDYVFVFHREVIKRSFELGATALILVHNHPSGDPSPSSSDVRMTREIADIAKPLGITVHDHIIVGRTGHISLRSLKLF